MLSSITKPPVALAALAALMGFLKFILGFYPDCLLDELILMMHGLPALHLLNLF